MRLKNTIVRLLICVAALSCLTTIAVSAERKVKKHTIDDRSLRMVAKDQKSEAKKIALVIGNSAYSSSPLKNPANDAKVVAQTLRRLGFHVEEKTNLGYLKMNETIEHFGSRLKKGNVGLFYYAGHGMQVNGNNYLIPVDTKLNSENEARYKTVDVGLILAKMEQSKSEVNIVILDACRDNPFTRSFRSVNHGLSFMDAPSGTFIAYATSPGKTADDGDGANGLYTSELVKALETPGLSLEQVFKRTAKAVLDKSNMRQTPWTSSSLVGDFWFVPFSGKSESQTELETKKPDIMQSGKDASQALNSPMFLEELEEFLKKSTTPVSDLKQLAKNGDILAQARLCAVATHERFNLGLKPSDGITYCKDLAEKSIPIGMFLYGRAYTSGRGIDKSDAEAIRWYRMAIEKGSTHSMVNLGGMYSDGRGVAKDESEAIKLYRMAAEKGQPVAIMNLGTMYYKGHGVVKDNFEALKWFRMGAENGDPYAMAAIGWMYANGRGVAKDDTEAVKWFRMSAEKGEPEGIYALGWRYADGHGVAKDDSEAVKWFRMGAEKGYPVAMGSLGWMYANGRGVAKDDSEAVKWFRMAVEKGEPIAMAYLAIAYEIGQGVPMDINQAIYWYKKSAEKGNEAAIKALKRLGK